MPYSCRINRTPVDCWAHAIVVEVIKVTTCLLLVNLFCIITMVLLTITNMHRLYSWLNNAIVFLMFPERNPIKKEKQLLHFVLVLLTFYEKKPSSLEVMRPHAAQTTRDRVSGWYHRLLLLPLATFVASKGTWSR